MTDMDSEVSLDRSAFDRGVHVNPIALAAVVSFANKTAYREGGAVIPCHRFSYRDEGPQRFLNRVPIPLEVAVVIFRYLPSSAPQLGDDFEHERLSAVSHGIVKVRFQLVVAESMKRRHESSLFYREIGDEWKIRPYEFDFCKASKLKIFA